MKIISIANFKGGTGKTVTACNLAAILAREGKRVLVIDADAQHNSSDFFGADPEGCTLTDVLEGTGEPTAADNVQETVFDRLDVLPADMGLLRLDLAAILTQDNAPLRRMDDFLDALREDGDYDLVLIDCPPSFTAASVAALVNSDEVLMPTRSDAFSRNGVLEIREQLENVGLRLLRPLPRIRVLVTMAHSNATLPKQVTALYKEAGFEVCRTVIRSGEVVNKSTWQRNPLYVVASGTNVSQDYERLADEIFDSEKLRLNEQIELFLSKAISSERAAVNLVISRTTFLRRVDAYKASKKRPRGRPRKGDIERADEISREV